MVLQHTPPPPLEDIHHAQARLPKFIDRTFGSGSFGTAPEDTTALGRL